MPPGAVMVVTPYYVLRDRNRSLGPEMAPSPPGLGCAPIYGFSSASAYHKFRESSEQLLTPYPLVKTYLRLQANGAGQELKLVVIDAAGRRASRLRAATMAEVLRAQEDKLSHVSAGYQLVFDLEASAYRVESEPA